MSTPYPEGQHAAVDKSSKSDTTIKIRQHVLSEDQIERLNKLEMDSKAPGITEEEKKAIEDKRQAMLSEGSGASKIKGRRVQTLGGKDNNNTESKSTIKDKILKRLQDQVGNNNNTHIMTKDNYDVIEHQAQTILTELLDLIKEKLRDDSDVRKVKIMNFGTWTVKNKRARVGRNPATNKQQKIEARTVVTFTPAVELRNKVDTNLKGYNKTNKVVAEVTGPKGQQVSQNVHYVVLSPKPTVTSV